MKRIAFCLAFLAGVSLTTSADAVHGRPVHDLTSLALESELIVLARTDGDALVVDRVLSGQGLDVGQRVEAEGAPAVSDVGSEPAIIFLKRVARGTQMRWSVVESGERITVGGRVLRYMQEPDRLGATMRLRPVGDDPLDVRGLDVPADGMGRTLPEVEQQIQRAVERAARVRKLLDDVAANRAALLDELGPVDDDAAPDFAIDKRMLDHHDIVAVRILDAFAAAGDAAAILEGHARCRSRLPRYEAREVSAALVTAAADARADVRHRLAALAILGRSSITNKPERDAILALRNDETPRVRAAALRVFARDDTVSKSERALFWDRWPNESDGEVQLEMMFLARRFRASAALDRAHAAEPVLFAERRGRRIHFRWDGWNDPWRLVDATVEARPAGAKQSTDKVLSGDDLHCWGRDELSKECEGDYDVFDAPPPEDVDLSLAVTLERNGETVRRVFPLAPRTASRAPGKPNADPPPLPETATSPAATQPAPPASGCACNTAVAPPGGAPLWALVALALAGCARSVRDGTTSRRR